MSTSGTSSTRRPAVRSSPSSTAVAAARSRAASHASAAAPPRSASRAIASAAADAPSYATRPDVLAYIDDLVERRHFDRDALRRLFADAHYSATAARLLAPAPTSGTRRDWNAYRARFVEPVRLAAGYRFWDDNAEALARAERDFGVPAEIIVGILGVETIYGRNTGTFRVLDVLCTLAFDFPASAGRDRSGFFRDELADALALDRDGLADLATLRGSYAGAIGMPQFMPGSIRRFAVDYDGDGRIDLGASTADVIGSVANFLAQHGWVRDLPTHVPLAHPAPFASEQAARVDAMVDAGSVPTFEFSDLADAGFVAATLPPMTKLALIDLPAGTDASGAPLTTYVAGTQNFHVVTRYNRSYFYAMSVIELGATIKALRDAEQAAKP